VIPGNTFLLESFSSEANGDGHQNPTKNESTESAADEMNTTAGNGHWAPYDGANCQYVSFHFNHKRLYLTICGP
jgi:hypothetical protein